MESGEPAAKLNKIERKVPRTETFFESGTLKTSFTIEIKRAEGGEVYKFMTKYDTVHVNDFPFAVNNNGHEDEGEKDPELLLCCNHNSYSPLWTCTYAAEITVSWNENQSITKKIAEIKAEYEKAKYSFRFGESSMKELVQSTDSNTNYAMEVKITVLNATGVKPRLITYFDEPYMFSDCVLICEGKKLYANKALLSVNSPYFNKLFYGEFQDAKNTEFPMIDVEYEDMVYLLRALYPERMEVTADTVERLLVLADRWSVFDVMRRCDRYLQESSRDSSCQLPLSRRIFLSSHYLLGEALMKLTPKDTTKKKEITQSDEFQYLTEEVKKLFIDEK